MEDGTSKDALAAYHHAAVLRSVIIEHNDDDRNLQSKEEVITAARTLIDKSEPGGDQQSCVVRLQQKGWITSDQYVFPREGRLAIAPAGK